MSVAGPCSVLRDGGMRGLSPFSHPEQTLPQQQQRQQHAFPNMGIRFGNGATIPPSSCAWNDNDTSLPDILAPALRSVSSLMMSIDPEDSAPPPAAAAAAASAAVVSGGLHGNGNMNSRTGNNAISLSTSRSVAKEIATGSNAMNSTIVDPFLSPLPPPPAPMDSSTHLSREQSFPPAPFFSQQPRFARDQSFPPPTQQEGGLAGIDTLPASSSIQGGWPNGVGQRPVTTEAHNSGGGSMMEDDGGIFDAGVGGGAPSMPNFRGLGFPLNSSASSLQMKGWGPDKGGGRGHLGGGTGGSSSLGDEDNTQLFDGILSSPPSSRPRRPSFDKLAAMIPDIPHWPSPSPSSATSVSPTSKVSKEAGELQGSTRAEPAQLPAPTSRSCPSPPSLPTSAAQVHPTRGRSLTSTRSERPTKEPERRVADSPRLPPAVSNGGSRWMAPTASSPANPASVMKKTPSSGTGKRGTVAPLSCGPARAGSGPVDLAKQERRRVKIQRYLYKRSRRKFAKSTRDASPSRSRPKAAAKRPRIKGKFIKTTPDYVSVNAGQPEGDGGGSETVSKKEDMPPLLPCNTNGVLVGGGGVRSVRDGGGVNINFNDKPFSTIPPSSVMPGGGGGGVRLPPRVSTLVTGATSEFSWTM